MSKPLSEMTNEELWELFPIILQAHNPAWKERYLQEKLILERIIGQNNITRIDHIGSTSVPGLIAKPTVDILVQLHDDVDVARLTGDMGDAGYGLNTVPGNPPPHLTFLKGYTPRGFRGQVYHIHIRYAGDWDELYFRDYLTRHDDVAQEYGKLKQELKIKYEHDRDGYTQAKGTFIRSINKLARLESSGMI